MYRYPYSLPNSNLFFFVKGYEKFCFIFSSVGKSEVILVEAGGKDTQAKKAVRDKRGRWEARNKQLAGPAEELFYYCSPCNFRTDNPWKFKRHYATQKHVLCAGDDSVESSAISKPFQACPEVQHFSLESPAAGSSHRKRAEPHHRSRASPASRSCGERRDHSTRKSALSAQEKVSYFQ